MVNHRFFCFRCGHSGVTHLKKPKACPRCNNHYYATPKIRGGGWSYISPDIRVRLKPVYYASAPFDIDKKIKLHHYEFVADNNGDHYYSEKGVLYPLTLELSIQFDAIIYDKTGYRVHIKFKGA